ncbi:MULTISPECIES: DNA cytosine methyltransferase [unclassified Dysgonomonas]|uniref:DNA cytosine methyltransferase n=1 Tax=unclassified Dysgonomonas TaxID=2630389 RepID=UPI0013D14D36|nr:MULTISPECIES: DNA cytosine methyltransferase [unclassified Dysgonomonas]NDV80133.1 DNA cytosine methyltransferase [Dysgonomonas sp. 511]NDW08428.1 DNA cytosine methyltransferase [Dysgonomonas sp. 520]
MEAKYKAIDFFCGGGGMTCGLRQAGIDVIAGVDFDKDAQNTYELNNPGAKFILSDIKKLRSNYFEKKMGIQKNDDYLILVGCSPCQFYSIINTDKEKSKKSKDLLRNFSRFIDYYNPGFVVVENVPGLKTNEKSILPDFLKFLTKKNYKICENVVDLSYYGVPQSRKRFSLIASRVSDNISLPKADEKQALLSMFIGESNGFKRINAGHKDTTDFNHTAAGLQSICLERLAVTPHNGGDRFAWKDNPYLQLKCFIGKDDSFKDTYGRMFWDKPASTITTKFFSISNGRFAHPQEDRAISLREGATLQTFPKDYIFKTTSIAATAKLIGNAVPPEYAKRVGLSIINSLPDGTV